MSPPTRHLTRMVLFVIAVAAVAVALSGALAEAFTANAGLNSLIAATFLIGVAFTFRSVLTLRPEIRWIEVYQLQREGKVAPLALARPRLLAPMARMMGDRRGRLSLSALAMRSLLDGISARLDESREISRYFVGLLIFLGLLGTFWGLLETISSVGRVIDGMSADQSDLQTMFSTLQEGLAEPLGGMGTAFSASLFGLSGSLVLGFLELQASQAQNRFYNELEDWLAGAAHLAPGALTAEGEAGSGSYLQMLVEQTAESLEALQAQTTAADEDRQRSTAAMLALADRLGHLNDQLRAQHTALARLVDQAAQDRFGIDEPTRAALQGLGPQVETLAQEVAAGRAQTVAEIRQLARILAALSEGTEP